MIKEVVYSTATVLYVHLAMIEVSIKPSWVKAAKKEAEEMGALRKSITKGEGNCAGFLGEIVVSKHLGVKRDNTFQYDLVGKKEVKYDVKTKRCKSKPLPNYTVSVCALNTKQACDIYIFVRVNKEQTLAWILGYMEKEDYFKQAKFCKRGELDPDSNCHWSFKEDCYNMYIKDLKDIKKLKPKEKIVKSK